MRFLVTYSSEDGNRNYEISIEGLDKGEQTAIKRQLEYFNEHGAVKDKIHPNPLIDAIRNFISNLGTEDIHITK